MARTDLKSKYSDAVWTNDVTEMPQKPEEKDVPNSTSGREGKKE